MSDTSRPLLDVPDFDADAYCDPAAAAVRLPLPEGARPGVIANLERTWAFAQLLVIDAETARVDPLTPVVPPDLRP